jgi:hypothetical protein
VADGGAASAHAREAATHIHGLCPSKPWLQSALPLLMHELHAPSNEATSYLTIPDTCRTVRYAAVHRPHPGPLLAHQQRLCPLLSCQTR